MRGKEYLQCNVLYFIVSKYLYNSEISDSPVFSIIYRETPQMRQREKPLGILVKAITYSAIAVALSGCQTPAVHVMNAVLNGGNTELAANMRQVNVAAHVIRDETWAGDYPFTARNQLYTVGVIKGEPEYSMRVAFLQMRHPEYGAWVRAGGKGWVTTGIIPDHLPALKQGDVVELRQTGTANVVKNFVASGEGNVVLHILCRAADPKYKECLAALPRIGTYQGFGETSSYYPESVREYGYTFSPKYDAKGAALPAAASR